MKADVPKVSVCMVTYNHERFIAQAIEGVLLQRTAFPIELVIGVDYSTDNTLIIAQLYAQKYPEIIRLLSAEKNLGAYNNFNRTLKECRGEYLAYCDGDDYWTDPRKIAMQAVFLDKHSDYSVCFHNALVHYEQRVCKDHPFYYEPFPPPPETTGLNCLLRGNFIQTQTLMVRNYFAEGLPGWMKELPLGDWVITILAARHGKLRYIDEIMATYRVHDGGVWTRLPMLEKIENLLKAAIMIRKNIKFAFSECLILNAYIILKYVAAAQCVARQGRRKQAAEYYWQMVSGAGNKTINYFLAMFFLCFKRLMPEGVMLRLFDLWHFVRGRMLPVRGGGRTES